MAKASAKHADARHGIAICGSMVGDVHYSVDAYPAEGSLAPAHVGEQHAGGIGNLIGQLSRLAPELPLQVSCTLGTDAIADAVLDELAAPAVDFSRIVRTEGPSAHTLVIDSLDSGERTFYSVSDPAAGFDDTAVDVDSFSARVFLLEYLLLMPGMDAVDEEYGTHAARLLAQARAAGMITAVDVVSERSERAHDIICAALPHTDVISFNEVEAERATGIAVKASDERAAHAALDALAEAGVAKWAVIHMPEVAYGLDVTSGEHLRLPSLRVRKEDIRGTTGAGDAFMAGILYGAHEDWSLKESMMLARASAACSLYGTSGFNSMRTVPEVLDLAFDLGER